KGLPQDLELGVLHPAGLGGILFAVAHDTFSSGIFEDRGIKPDSLFSPAFSGTCKEQQRTYLLFHVSLVEHKLPVQAKFVLYPAVPVTPFVFVQWHEDLSSLFEFFPELLYPFP